MNLNRYRARKLLPALLAGTFLLAAVAGMPAAALAVGYGECGPIDLTIALDDTGSMGGAIDNIKAELPTIISTALFASGDDLRVGYMTFKDDITVHNQLTNDTAAVNASINATTAWGGAGGPEASDEAKNTAVNNLAGGIRSDSAGNNGNQVGNYTEAYRNISTKIVVLITDAPPGGFNDAQDAQDNNALAFVHANTALAKGILVSDIFVPTGGDYAGQAALLESDANITGGAFITTEANGTGTGEAITAIIEACGGEPVLGSISGMKFHDMNGDGLLNIGEPALGGWEIVLTMPDGTVLTTITAGNGTYSFGGLTPGTYYVNEVPQEGWYQTAPPETKPIEIAGGDEVVVDFGNKMVPQATCVETVNPAGKNIPPAGKTTLPGAKGGQNEDGFYQLLAKDETGPLPVFVIDTGSSTTFGPYPSGTNIKYTEANGVTPSENKIGGPASAVSTHIKGNGDAAVYAVDVNGVRSRPAYCMVPPLPK